MRSCSSSWKVRYCSRIRKSAAFSAVRGSARPATGIGPVNSMSAASATGSTMIVPSTSWPPAWG